MRGKGEKYICFSSSAAYVCHNRNVLRRVGQRITQMDYFLKTLC
jgi:hypothetical protein